MKYTQAEHSFCNARQDVEHQYGTLSVRKPCLNSKEYYSKYGGGPVERLHNSTNPHLSTCVSTMLAGLWPLKACRIEGPFDVGQIAGLLPHTLHHLHVQVDIEHRNCHSVGIGIGIFQRFRNLRSLHLSAFEYVTAAAFRMQSPMVLPNLRYLHLLPWPFKHNCTLADSFPLLTHAALHVHATAFIQYVKLPHIEYLGVKIGRLGNEGVHMNVKVGADSHLNCLVLSVPENVKLDVSLDKPNLIYRISGSGGTTCVCSPANLQRVYQLPKHFRAL